MIPKDAPKDNLLRMWVAPAELRAAGKDDEWGTAGRVLRGQFAVFNRWTEIDSWWEGRFLERIAPGAFDRSLAECGDRVKVLYDHGHDPQLGNKPLGPYRTWSDGDAQWYDVDLIETSYNDDFIIPAARANLLGSSFRFAVVAEEWKEKPTKSKANPMGLPERTIKDVDLYEFGPVTFPAYAESSAGMRSRSDEFVDKLLGDPRFVARFTERVGATVVERIIDSLPTDGRSIPKPDTGPATPDATPDGQTRGHDARLLRLRAVLATHRIA